MLLHGLPGLDGARELSPGLGIYRGGFCPASFFILTRIRGSRESPSIDLRTALHMFTHVSIVSE